MGSTTRAAGAFPAALRNWTCHHAAPRWDAGAGLYTEPLLPHTPLSIVHQTMWTKGQ